MDADERLAADLRRGDPSAAERLYARFAKPLLNFIHASVRDRGAAEDLVQETLAAALGHMDTYRDGSLSGWLFRIARNRSLNWLRDEGRAARAISAMPPAPGPVDPGEGAERTELRAVLRESLDSLAESDQEVIVLCDMNGLSYREAAEAMNVTEKALSVRLARARQRLKDAVKKRMAAP